MILSVLSGFFFEGARYGNRVVPGTGAGDTLVISEGTGIGIKLSITDGEVTGSTLGTADFFSGARSEGGMGIFPYGGIGDGNEELDESELGF